MPICEADPWRMQYFQDVVCPPDVRIPTEDFDAYEWNPAHHWVYNKLLVAESQGILCAPHGVTPRSYPVFSKPIIKSARQWARAAACWRTLRNNRRHESGGHFWMTLLARRTRELRHCRRRRQGRVVQARAGHSHGEGTFDYWTVHAEAYPDLERYCGAWLARKSRGLHRHGEPESIGGLLSKRICASPINGRISTAGVG